MQSVLTQNLTQIRALCASHHVRELFAFGSVVRDDFSASSDVDFLYEFDLRGHDFNDVESAPYDYFENFFSLKEALESLLQRNVDLVPQKRISNKIVLAQILAERQLVFAA